MNDEKEYWFPAKTFGWGWGLPVKWQGWVVLAVYALLLFAGIRHFGGRPDAVPVIRLYILGLTAVLLIVTYLKGEKPRWRWGNK